MALIASLVDFEGFLAAATAINTTILDIAGPLFSYAPFCAVLLIVLVYVSPLGRVRIGGENAKPILSLWNWFAITLCTTIATGILFWGTAEPIFHLNGPPGFAGAEANSPEAARFALASLYFHWAITPYAIYSAPALAFALAYYNLGAAYSLSAPLSLAMGGAAKGAGAAIIDAIALFALVAGVAASLGAGVLTLVGGVASVTGLADTPFLRFIILVGIVVTFIASSVSGLHRGIRFFSDMNVRLFLLLAAFVFIAGPTWKVLTLGADAFVHYITEFLPRSLRTGGDADAEWVRSWTFFNFANWAAWAPITALFLGRIAVGRTVREIIHMNLLAPALFGVFWMTIFGGAALTMDQSNAGAMSAALKTEGPEGIIYAMFQLLPFAGIVIAVFLTTTFVSFVTAMDSNTHSIASVCMTARRQEDETQGAGLWVKLFWGVLIGAVAFIMTATNGVAGVRMLSNLGGAPGLLILIGSMAALCRLIWRAYHGKIA